MKDVKRAFQIIGMGLLAAAIVNELLKPPGRRSWRGRLNFSVPYDLTPPTFERMREAYWNPDDDRILTERVFGVGWAINFHALLKKLGFF